MKILPSSSLDSDKQLKTSSEIKPLRELPSSALKHHTGRSSFELETGWLSHWEQTSRYHCHSCVMQVFLVGAQGPVCCRLILDVLWEDPQYLRLAEIWETTEIQPQTLVAAVSSFSHSRLLGSLISDGSVSPPGQWKARAKQDGCGEQQQVMHGCTGKPSFCTTLQQSGYRGFVFVDSPVCAVTPMLGCRIWGWSHC